MSASEASVVASNQVCTTVLFFSLIWELVGRWNTFLAHIFLHTWVSLLPYDRTRDPVFFTSRNLVALHELCSGIPLCVYENYSQYVCLCMYLFHFLIWNFFKAASYSFLFYCILFSLLFHIFNCRGIFNLTKHTRVLQTDQPCLRKLGIWYTTLWSGFVFPPRVISVHTSLHV